jgi:isopenicillin N synthase-like dioxygenase
MASETRYVSRVIPRISLHDFEDRIDEITNQLIEAAEKVGFFTLTDHGISNEEIESMFAPSKTFFNLPDEVKATVPWNPNSVG